jgi:hypothetical protein
MSLLSTIVDRFFAKDLWVEISPPVFTFHLEANQLQLKTYLWIQKPRNLVLAVGEELEGKQSLKAGTLDDIQRVELFPATPADDFQIINAQYLEAFFRFAFFKLHKRAIFVRPKVHFTGSASLRPHIPGGFEMDLLKRTAFSAGASAVIFA